MNLEQQMQALALDCPSLGQVAKNNPEQQPDEPSQRRFHSAVVHKTSLYVYGGLLKREAKDSQNEHSLVYRYNFTTKIWTKIQTHFLNNISFSHIYAHSTIVFNNMMYLFGGKNSVTDTYVAGLWCLNLQSYNWKRQQLKGYSPLPRQFASFVLHQRSSIVLYGGRHLNQNLNDVHIYRIESKVWQQVQQNSYDLKIPCRLKPALCSHGDHLYLFGGQRMTISEQGIKTTLLKDFYQIKIIQRPMNSKPDFWVKNIITHTIPTQRVATFINVFDKYIAMIGNSDDRHKNKDGFWLYSIANISWVWVKFQEPMINFPSYGFSVNSVQEKCLIFGQYEQQQEDASSGLTTINLDFKQMQSKINTYLSKFKNNIIQSSDCWECNQHQNSLAQHTFNQFNVFNDMLISNMPLVYSAFGLLIDNSLMLGAKQAKIIFSHTFKQKYCLIQDNGSTHKMWPNHNQFIYDMLTIRTYVEENIDQLEEEHEEEENPQGQCLSPVHHPTSILINKESKQLKEQKEKDLKDKQLQKQLKKKKRAAKQHAKKKKEERIEYCRNLKLGALRIGDRVISVTRYGASFDNRRVFVIQKCSNQQKQISYKSYYYIYQNGALVDSQMDSSKRYIDEQYKSYLKIVSDHKDQSNNFVFITSLKEIINSKGQLQPQLKQSVKYKDIYCCQKSIMDNLEESQLWDSLDISLKNYLSMLYLKNDDLKISFSISQNRNIQINNSDFFQKIDSLGKSQKPIDLVPALDLEHCSIIQVYYNRTNSRARQLSRKANSFNFLNGVLFYSKNRLISRYKFPLSQSVAANGHKLKIIQQALMMFGFIEIKPQFTVNIFKTQFVREDLLEDIHQRLKFVEKYAEEKLNKQGKDDPINRRPGQQRQQTRKRFRGNEDQRYRQYLRQ